MPAPTAPAPEREAISLSPTALEKFPANVIRTIARTVAAPAAQRQDVPLINRFLELAAVLDLNPLAGEIWLAQMSGRDGGPGRLAILIGRDGYLKISRRDEAFIDVDADCVYENDEFRVARKADGTRSIEHSYGHPKDRGRLHGAYGVLRRRGYPDRYFYAPLAQYDKDHEKSAWKYTDAMCIKAASSYIMRTTYGISGPVPADEVGVPLQFPGDGPDGAFQQAPPPLDSAIAPLFERARTIDAHAFSENELRARTRNATPAQLNQVVHELEAWLREHEAIDSTAEEIGEEPSDAHAQASERWRSDERWRVHVLSLMNRRMDLETALSDSDPEQASLGDEMIAELNSLDAQIREAGVPDGWGPPSSEEER